MRKNHNPDKRHKINKTSTIPRLNYHVFFFLSMKVYLSKLHIVMKSYHNNNTCINMKITISGEKNNLAIIQVIYFVISYGKEQC